jgi:hypothetical protein
MVCFEFAYKICDPYQLGLIKNTITQAGPVTLKIGQKKLNIK